MKPKTLIVMISPSFLYGFSDRSYIPNDSYSKMTEKIETYLSDGVRLLWIVDPQRKTVTIYEGNAAPKSLRAGNTLSSEPVLPGFAMNAKDIFVG